MRLRWQSTNQLQLSPQSFEIKQHPNVEDCIERDGKSLTQVTWNLSLAQKRKSSGNRQTQPTVSQKQRKFLKGLKRKLSPKSLSILPLSLRTPTVVKMPFWWPNFNKIPSQWQAQTDTEHDSLMCLQLINANQQKKNPSDGVRLCFTNPSYWR